MEQKQVNSVSTMGRGQDHRKVVLITGSSSGIGLATALEFHQKGWHVVATMRNPEQRKTPLHGLADMTLLHVDVLDETSMEEAVRKTVQIHGRIDALVNNAGYDLIGAVELMTLAQIRRQLDTNVGGLIRMTGLVLPVMKRQKSGVILQVSSIGGRLVFPGYSAYHATKFAVEGFTESLCYEADPFGIRVRLIEPGPIRTAFYHGSLDKAGKYSAESAPAAAVRNVEREEASAWSERVVRNGAAFGERGSPAEVVAKTIWKAANARSKRLRYVTGRAALLMVLARRLLPFRWFMAATNATMMAD